MIPQRDISIAAQRDRVPEPAEKGWNYFTREVHNVGYVEVYAETYRCASKIEGDLADIYVQCEPRPRGVGAAMPEGGWFKFVVEVKRLSERETSVKSFGAGVPDAVFDVVHQWAGGADLPAPPFR